MSVSLSANYDKTTYVPPNSYARTTAHKPNSVEHQDTLLYDDYPMTTPTPYVDELQQQQQSNIVATAAIPSTYHHAMKNVAAPTTGAIDNKYIDYYDDQCTIGDTLSNDQRQWDNSGRGTSLNKMLPKIGAVKPSNSVNDEFVYDQASHYYGGGGGGVGVGGAALPPTPASIGITGGGKKTPRLLPQPKATAAACTAQRMLPQMPRMMAAKQLLHQRHGNDTEYSDPESFYSAYTYRPGAVSATIATYNEDYNYAYQSTDSLNQAYSECGSGRRKGAALPVVPATTAATMQQQQYAASTAGGVLQSTSSFDYCDMDTSRMDDYVTTAVPRKSKRLPTPIIGGGGAHKLPRIPIDTVSRKKQLPVITTTSSSSLSSAQQHQTNCYNYESINDNYAVSGSFTNVTPAPSYDYYSSPAGYLDDITDVSAVPGRLDLTSSSAMYDDDRDVDVCQQSFYYDNDDDGRDKTATVGRGGTITSTMYCNTGYMNNDTYYGRSDQTQQLDGYGTTTAAATQSYSYLATTAATAVTATTTTAATIKTAVTTSSGIGGITSFTKTLSSIFQNKLTGPQQPSSVSANAAGTPSSKGSTAAGSVLNFLQQQQQQLSVNKTTAATTSITGGQQQKSSITTANNYYNSYQDDDYYYRYLLIC